MYRKVSVFVRVAVPRLGRSLYAPVVGKKRVPDGLPVHTAGISSQISSRRIFHTRALTMSQNTGIITGAVRAACTEATNGERGFWAGFFHLELLRREYEIMRYASVSESEATVLSSGYIDIKEIMPSKPLYPIKRKTTPISKKPSCPA